jgi:hypothetical protein
MANRSAVANSWRVGPDGLSWGRFVINVNIAARMSQYAGPGHFNNIGLLISVDGSGKRMMSETQTRSKIPQLLYYALALTFLSYVSQRSLV